MCTHLITQICAANHTHNQEFVIITISNEIQTQDILNVNFILYFRCSEFYMYIPIKFTYNFQIMCQQPTPPVQIWFSVFFNVRNYFYYHINAQL